MAERDFISLKDITPDEIRALLSLSKKLKQDGSRCREDLKGKTFALIFQKPSNRTRVSFETGIFQLGGSTIYLGSDDISLGKREPTSDVALTLSRFVHGIVARVFDHQDILDLAHYATVPVINGLSDLSHPCQALADMLTVEERFGKLKGLKMAYVGDGNNVCNSLILACAKTGVDLYIATPEGYEPDAGYVKLGQDAVRDSGSKFAITRSAEEAVRGAQVIYTDTWISMGQEEEAGERLKDFVGYQIDDKLAGLADKDFIFMHCLPAHRGQEVSEKVIDGPHSVIFDQAENRLHVQKAVLISLFAFNNK
jgi:ornithine carbamoyltransferase